MDNVIKIGGGNVIVLGEPVPEVISDLEAVLADAKAGVVRSVAMVVIQSDGRWATLCKGEDETLKLIGALRMLERFVMDDADPRHTCQPLK
jgi:hypothetical protein